MANDQNNDHLTEDDQCVLKRARNLNDATSIRALRSQCQTEECKKQIDGLAQAAEISGGRDQG